MTESYTNKLRIIDIVDGTIVDGPGLRTSIYFAGCAHKCPGCHNPESWDFEAGFLMEVEEIIDHVVENDFNVTLSGGDPLYQMPQLTELCKRLKGLGKNIWCYTGFTFEEVSNSAALSPILEYIDVMVDGPFIEAKRDISLRFKGSSNQRLINVKESTSANIVTWTDKQ